eukprot:Skav202080  [mRNA]  locus=scaffold1138:925450:926383:+ [translate_table: standard]
MTDAMNLVLDHNGMMMPVVMTPGARTAPALVVAAPRLLALRPTMVPIGEPGIAIIGLHHMDLFLPVTAARLVVVAAP